MIKMKKSLFVISVRFYNAHNGSRVCVSGGFQSTKLSIHHKSWCEGECL